MTSTTSVIPASDASEPRLIRTDAWNRLHRTPEQREQILDEYEPDEQSQSKRLYVAKAFACDWQTPSKTAPLHSQTRVSIGQEYDILDPESRTA